MALVTACVAVPRGGGLEAVADPSYDGRVTNDLALVPRPRLRDAQTVVAAPGAGPGYWAGGPSAVAADGVFHLAYRLRRPVGTGRGYANVVASSRDGVHFDTVCVARARRVRRPSRSSGPRSSAAPTVGGAST